MESDRMIEELVGSAEVTRTQLSRSAALFMLADLETYPEAQVLGALARCRRELKPGQFTLEAILSRLDDGRPGPEEAWAMMPKSEYDSAVLTQEQLTAWGIAHDLVDVDPIAARMAFKEAYNRLISEARAQRRPCDWQVSLGMEKTGRVAALQAAVAAGRITAKFAMSHCPGEHIENMQLALGVDSHGAIAGPTRDVRGVVAGVLSSKLSTQ